MKDILRQILALLWKLIRTYVLRWLKVFLGKFAIWGVAAFIFGAVAMVALVLLLSSC